MLRGLILFVFAFCLAYPAWGGEAAKKDAKPDPGNTMKMPFLVVPMSDNGTLLGHTYVSSKMICSSPAACTKVAEKLAFIQDGFVREVYSRPVALAGSPKEIDKPQLCARLTAVARRIVGADKVTGIEILETKFAVLHPSDSVAAEPPPDQPADADAKGGAKDGKTPADGAKKGKEPAKNGPSKGATSKPG
jgi:hypothetical protein